MQTPLYDSVPPLVAPVVLTLWLLVLLQRSPLPLVRRVGAERVLFGSGSVLQYPACNVAKVRVNRF